MNPSYPDFDMKLKGGSALNIGIQHVRHVGFGKLYTSLRYQKWNLEQSEVLEAKIDGTTYGFVEPKNNTTTIAADVGLLF